MLYTPLTVTIPANSSVSTIFSLQGRQLAGVLAPPSWDYVSAPKISFECSFDGGATWNQVSRIESIDTRVTVFPGLYVPVTSDIFRGLDLIRIRAGYIDHSIVEGDPIEEISDHTVVQPADQVFIVVLA